MTRSTDNPRSDGHAASWSLRAQTDCHTLPLPQSFPTDRSATLISRLGTRPNLIGVEDIG